MRLLIKICFYISLAVDCHAQIYTDQLDSIHKILSTTSNDTIRMDMFARLGFYFDDVNLDSAVYYGEKGAAIASRLRLELNEA